VGYRKNLSDRGIKGQSQGKSTTRKSWEKVILEGGERSQLRKKEEKGEPEGQAFLSAAGKRKSKKIGEEIYPQKGGTIRGRKKGHQPFL